MEEKEILVCEHEDIHLNHGSKHLSVLEFLNKIQQVSNEICEKYNITASDIEVDCEECLCGDYEPDIAIVKLCYLRPLSEQEKQNRINAEANRKKIEIDAMKRMIDIYREEAKKYIENTSNYHWAH